MASNLTSIGLWLDDDPYGAPAPGETRASSSGGSGGSGLAGHLKAKAPLMLGPLTNFVMNRLPGAKNIEKAPTPRGIAGIPNRAAEIVAGVPGGVFQMVSDSTRLPYHAARALAGKEPGDFGKTFPAIYGMGDGFRTTGEHVSAIWNANARHQIAEEYSGDPLGMALNDISNIAVVAAPAAKAAGIAGQAAEAGSLSARAASATQKIASGTAKVADLPVAPYRLPLTRAGEVIGKSAYNAEMAAAGAEGVQAGTLGSALQRVGLSQPLARFSPEGKLLSNELLEGRAREANYAHDVLEADLPQLETQLSQIPKANRAARQQVIDNYLETHQETIGPRVAELRSESAARISGMPFAHQLDPVRSPQGKLFGEADQADLAPVPEGYVRMSELRGGDMSTLYKGADDIVLPKPLADQVQSFFGAPMKGSEALRGVLGPVNKVNYTLKLGLSPAWATGNLVGNAFTTLANAGVRGLRQYASDIRTGDFADDSARLQRAAPTRATIDQMQMTAVPEAEGNFAQRITTKAVQKAQKVTFYRLAERFDNAARSAVFKTELSRGASPELALEKTLRAMGEFDKLSPFERDYVKQIAPFWTWHREILKMSKNMLEEHPVRSGALLNMGNHATDDEELEPGEQEIDAGMLVPFGQAGDKFGGGYFGFGKILGPAPKAVVAVGTGANPSTGKDLQVGQKFGEQNTPGLHNSKAALAQLVKGFPQVRLANSLAGNDDFHTPAEGVASFLGVDVSHQPDNRKKKRSGNPNSIAYWLGS